MGYSVILDILGSIVISGMLMLILLRLNDATIENTYVSSGDLAVQQNLTTVVQILEHDFRKIGYCADWEQIPDPSKAILYADAHRIEFLTDENNDSKVDKMVYYIGPTSELHDTPNPRDRFLYRLLNNEPPVSTNLGVTQFDLKYFDVFNNEIPFPITVPGEIHTIQINITVEDPAAYDEKYNTVFWRQIRLAARNLRSR
jgi:hypothetical protein